MKRRPRTIKSDIHAPAAIVAASPAGLTLIAVLLLMPACAAPGCSLGKASEATEGGTAAAAMGDLVVTVTDGGTLRAAESIDIISRVEGNATVLWVIEEGTQVQKGDVLVRLDPTDLNERKTKEEIDLANQQASAKAAESDLNITRDRAVSEISKAELAVRFAEIDQEKYIKGDLPQLQRRAEAAIVIAKEELQRAADRLDGTKKLADEGIVSRQELLADEFAVTKSKINLEEAEKSLELLLQYESRKQLEKLQSDLEEARRELKRVKEKTASEIAQAEAGYNAKMANLKIQENKYNSVLAQLEETVIRAPQPGIIVYWTPRNRWGNQRPIEVGGQVRFRQVLIMLPDVSKMVVDVNVHESQVDRVHKGMPATIRVEAFQDRAYRGRVESISVMADSANWMTPDVKQYKTVVSIDPGQDMNGLKPNMNANVEIMVANIKNKLIVPITGVHTLRGRTAALVVNGSRVEVREVKVGPTNDKMIIIEDGLRPGDVVMLHRPDVLPEIPWEEEENDRPPTADAPELIPGNLPPAIPAASAGESEAAGNGDADSSRRRRRPRPAGPDAGADGAATAEPGSGAARRRPAGSSATGGTVGTGTNGSPAAIGDGGAGGDGR